MARIKIDPRSAEDRVNDIANFLINDTEYGGENYAYASGYLQSALVRALELLPVGKRQLFLTSLEKQVRPKTRKVVNLMSGEMVEIAYDTPMSCDPSTETYWSM